jgi:hypothetical protein
MASRSLTVTFSVKYPYYHDPMRDPEGMRNFVAALVQGDHIDKIKEWNPDLKSIEVNPQNPEDSVEFQLVYTFDSGLSDFLTIRYGHFNDNEGTFIYEDDYLRDVIEHAFRTILERVFWIPPEGPRIDDAFIYHVDEFNYAGRSYSLDGPLPGTGGSQGGV